MKDRFKIALPVLFITLLAGGMAIYFTRQATSDSSSPIDSPSPDDGYLHGLMIDEQNQPVADTPVTLVVQRGLGINCASGQCDWFNKPVFHALEKTDEQGRFSIRVPQRYLANRGQPSMYIYKLEADIAPQKIKFFYNLNLARQETNEQTFIVKPPFWTMGNEGG